MFSRIFSIFGESGKLTCTKLYKFKGTNPPPVSVGGYKHFRNTSTYNNCVFDEPLYHSASYLSNHMVNLIRLNWNMFLNQLNNLFRMYWNWKCSTILYTGLTLFERFRYWSFPQIVPWRSRITDGPIVQRWTRKTWRI